MALLARSSLVVLLVFLASLAVRATVDNIRFSSYVAYGTNADPANPVVVADEKMAMAMADSCRTDIFGPGLRLQLLRLNKADPATDYQTWYQYIGAADAYLSAAIRCAPHRGDSWIRSAMVSQGIAENPQRLSGLMQYASALNPVERNQLIARVALWSRVSREVQDLNSDLISRDIGVVLEYGNKPLVAMLLNSKSEFIREMAISETAKLPDDRKRAIEAMKIE